VQNAHLVAISPLDSPGNEAIVSQPKGGGREQVLSITIRRKGSRFAHERVNDMMLIDAMLMLANLA
jgi:hypothetical protein